MDVPLLLSEAQMQRIVSGIIYVIKHKPVRLYPNISTRQRHVPIKRPKSAGNCDCSRWP